jgi:hypothetical protein
MTSFQVSPVFVFPNDFLQTVTEKVPTFRTDLIVDPPSPEKLI